MKIPFCLPLIDKDVNQEVLSCLNETGLSKTGPKFKLLEDEITELCQINSTICVNSWTSAMVLLIRWLDLDEDDEIIVPDTEKNYYVLRFYKSMGYEFFYEFTTYPNRKMYKLFKKNI
jgi:hypothetical protein